MLYLKMLYLNQLIFLGLLVSLVTACGDSQIIDVPASNLKPDQVKEISDERELAQKMFRSVVTKLKNGVLSATILRPTDDNKLKFAFNRSEKTLHELCQAKETCIGGIYSSVHNNQGKGEILHRIYQGQTMKIACAWVESYNSEFGPMDEILQQDVIGRSWHWVKACFED